MLRMLARRYGLSSAALAVALCCVAPGVRGQDLPTRPLQQTIVVGAGGPCIEHGELVEAVASWLRSYRADARLRVLVTFRAAPEPILSFWVRRQEKPIAERHLPAEGGSCEDVRAALAFAVALALDATILDAPSASPDVAPSPTPPPASPATPPPRSPPPRLAGGGMWLGPAVLRSAGGASPWVAGGVGGFWRPLSPLRVEADVLGTFEGGNVETGVGRVEVKLLTLGFALLLEPWPQASVSPAVGVGGGPLWAWAEPQPEPGVEGRSDQTVVAVMFGRARLAFHLGDQLGASLALFAGRTLPELRVLGDGQPLAILGRPLLGVALATGMAWR